MTFVTLGTQKFPFNRLLELVMRRPATVEDIALALNITPEQACRKAEDLLKSGVLCAEKMPNGVFYSAV